MQSLYIYSLKTQRYSFFQLFFSLSHYVAQNERERERERERKRDRERLIYDFFNLFLMSYSCLSQMITN